MRTSYQVVVINKAGDNNIITSGWECGLLITSFELIDIMHKVDVCICQFFFIRSGCPSCPGPSYSSSKRMENKIIKELRQILIMFEASVRGSFL